MLANILNFSGVEFLMFVSKTVQKKGNRRPVVKSSLKLEIVIG